jgi:1,4-dihydroxy-2-naphthoate octaprenyltransferase
MNSILKRIIVTTLILAAYIGCVVWIADGMVLRPHDKFLICGIGGVIIFAGATYPNGLK